MSPEQCRGHREIDGRADVYSVGCILYALVCAGPPFRYDTSGALIAAHQYEVPPAPRAINPAVPRRLEALILQLLSKAPEDRPGAARLLEELDALLPEMPDKPPAIGATPPARAAIVSATTFRRGSRRLGLVAAALALAGVGAVGALALRTRPAPVGREGRAPSAPGPDLPRWSAQIIGPKGAGRVVQFNRGLAGNSSGQAVATWLLEKDGGRDVWANVYDQKRGWGRPTRVRASDGHSVHDPAVALSPGGQALVLWMAGDADKSSHLWSSLYRPGRGWSEPSRIDFAGAELESPELAIDDRAGAIAIWRQEVKQDEGVLWFSHLPPGGRWTSPQRLDPGRPRDADLPRLVPNDSGRMVAAWIHRGRRAERLQVSEYVAGQGFGPPRTIYSIDDGHIEAPEIAMNEPGEIACAWRVRQGGSVSVWTASFTPAQGWSTPTKLTAREQRDAGSPQLGLARDGSGLLVWREPDLDVQSVYALPFSLRTGWGEERTIEEHHTDARHPELAMGAGGDAAVTWLQPEAPQIALWANVFHRKRGWGAPTPLQTTPGRVREARVTYAGDVAVAFWLQETKGTDGEVWAATLEVRGER
jgi:hypothetical protein